MNKLFFDIETIPADENTSSALKYLFERKMEKKKKKKEDVGDGFEEFLNNTSFDGGFGRIVCIAYAINEEEPQIICNMDDERGALSEFWRVANKIDLFVGHNIMDFDLRFLYQRSIVLGVRPTKELNFARYRNFPIFDTMKEWSKWGDSRDNKTLEHVALAFGIPTPKEGIDGSEVFRFFKDGKVKEICDYCMRDVETVRKIYKRMIFE